jgi:hypothetical protein
MQKWSLRFYFCKMIEYTTRYFRKKIYDDFVSLKFCFDVYTHELWLMTSSVIRCLQFCYLFKKCTCFISFSFDLYNTTIWLLDKRIKMINKQESIKTFPKHTRVHKRGNNLKLTLLPYVPPLVKKCLFSYPYPHCRPSVQKECHSRNFRTDYWGKMTSIAPIYLPY